MVDGPANIGYTEINIMERAPNCQKGNVSIPEHYDRGADTFVGRLVSPRCPLSASCFMSISGAESGGREITSGVVRYTGRRAGRRTV